MSDPGVGQIRDASPDDADAIARVHVQSWRETYAGVLAESNFSQEVLQKRTAFWSWYLGLAPRPGRMVVAEVAGEVVGFANAGDARGEDAEHGHPPARPLHLFSIYLLSEMHGSGLGQRLLDEVVQTAPAQLWVLQSNQRAIAFYQRNGFEPDCVVYRDPENPALVELRMVR